MSEVYIRADKDSGMVTFVHHKPFDPVLGLNSTRDELLKTGFFVEDYPKPNSVPGKKAVAYYDHERKVIHYEYQVVELSDKERLTMLEEAMNDIILNTIGGE